MRGNRPDNSRLADTESMEFISPAAEPLVLRGRICVLVVSGLSVSWEETCCVGFWKRINPLKAFSTRSIHAKIIQFAFLWTPVCTLCQFNCCSGGHRNAVHKFR